MLEEEIKQNEEKEDEELKEGQATEVNDSKDLKEDPPLSTEEVIDALNKDIEDLKDQRLRAVAELENFRKRSEKDQSDALKYGISNFAKEVISIMDNIERAKQSIKEDTKQEDTIKSVLEGIDLIHQSIGGLFEKFSIKKIISLDKKFDHNFHQAMMEVERDDLEPGIVVQELIPGYTLHDRLLRPAMVGVSKKANPKEHISEEKSN